jgi:hypothetical protein
VAYPDKKGNSCEGGVNLSIHIAQIMETQTRFDLNAAIAEWQQELAGQPELTPVVRRELETHLRDTVAELQGRGLNNEESFWLARRRTGQPRQLGREFAKAEPVKLWRERVFWVVLTILGVALWELIVGCFIGLSLQGGILKANGLMAGASYLLLIWLPVVVFAVWFSKGRIDFTGWVAFLLSRVRIATISAACILFYSIVFSITYRGNPGGSSRTSTEMFLALCGQISGACLLLCLSLWLMPRQTGSAKVPKRANVARKRY